MSIARRTDPRVGFAHLIFDSVGGVRVMSSVDFIRGRDTSTGKPRWEFHVSVSHLGGRAGNEVCAAVLRDFGMVGANEDNHQGPRGVVRNFWLPVDEGQDAKCPCQDEEKPHDEGNGYVWREAPPAEEATRG